jgi:hypothetical protein
MQEQHQPEQPQNNDGPEAKGQQALGNIQKSI